jgi:hypothetical protein
MSSSFLSELYPRNTNCWAWFDIDLFIHLTEKHLSPSSLGQQTFHALGCGGDVPASGAFGQRHGLSSL